MNKDIIHLTPRQKEVIRDLQNGGVLCTSSEAKGADVGLKDGGSYHINNGVFWNLVEKKVIWQNHNEFNNYTLTEYGKTINIEKGK